MQGSVLSMVSGIHRGPWNKSSMDIGELLYDTFLGGGGERKGTVTACEKDTDLTEKDFKVVIMNMFTELKCDLKSTRR